VTMVIEGIFLQGHTLMAGWARKDCPRPKLGNTTAMLARP
jgi:hypothetical protein